MGVIWHFLPLLSWLMRQSLWENGKNELGPRTLCLSVWPALSKAVDPQGPEGSAETFLTIRCLGRREWHSQGRCCSALFCTQLGPVHIIPSPRQSTPSQWQREKTTVKQCRADQACLLTSLSAKSTHRLQASTQKLKQLPIQICIHCGAQWTQTKSNTCINSFFVFFKKPTPQKRFRNLKQARMRIRLKSTVFFFTCHWVYVFYWHLNPSADF